MSNPYALSVQGMDEALAASQKLASISGAYIGNEILERDYRFVPFGEGAANNLFIGKVKVDYENVSAIGEIQLSEQDGMMVGELGFKATPDQAKVLLINKDFNIFEKEERDRIDLTGEPTTLAIASEPDLLVFESATQSTIGTVIPAIPDEEEVTVKSWEQIEDSTLEPPLEGFCNIRVDYNFNNLKDEEMKGSDIKIAVLDYSTGMLLKQGTFPLLDDELWIFEVEPKSNRDGFQCFEGSEGGKYAIVINLPFKEDYTVVPLS